MGLTLFLSIVNAVDGKEKKFRDVQSFPAHFSQVFGSYLKAVKWKNYEKRTTKADGYGRAQAVWQGQVECGGESGGTAVISE